MAMKNGGGSAVRANDFRAGSGPGKVRITIRLDREILDWFRSRAEDQEGGSYQTMINNALRDHVHQGGESLEAVLRRVIREELKSGGPEGDIEVIPRGRL
jgi:hypothetical protein